MLFAYIIVISIDNNLIIIGNNLKVVDGFRQLSS